MEDSRSKHWRQRILKRLQLLILSASDTDLLSSSEEGLLPSSEKVITSRGREWCSFWKKIFIKFCIHWYWLPYNCSHIRTSINVIAEHFISISDISIDQIQQRQSQEWAKWSVLRRVPKLDWENNGYCDPIVYCMNTLCFKMLLK